LGNILTDATLTLNGTFATTYTYSATGDANPVPRPTKRYDWAAQKRLLASNPSGD